MKRGKGEPVLGSDLLPPVTNDAIDRERQVELGDHVAREIFVYLVAHEGLSGERPAGLHLDACARYAWAAAAEFLRARKR